MIRLAPIFLGPALTWIQRVHSHLDAPVGGLVAVGVERWSKPPARTFRERARSWLTTAGRWELCCVALLGRPIAGALQAQGCAEVLRCASDGTRHAASMAYAAISRAGLALGYRRLVSSTLLGESGACLRAAGWRPVFCRLQIRGPEVADWRREGRGSGAPQQDGIKIRWEHGPEALPLDEDVDWLVRGSAGRRKLPRRVERALPLFAQTGGAA